MCFDGRIIWNFCIHCLCLNVYSQFQFQEDGENFVEAATYGSVPLLQDEIVHESPPLPDRDDSPPPIHRKFLKERDGRKF